MSREEEIKKRYEQISQSEWFAKTYHNKSIGETISTPQQVTDE